MGNALGFSLDNGPVVAYLLVQDSNVVELGEVSLFKPLLCPANTGSDNALRCTKD
jgi:hypothetical protein